MGKLETIYTVILSVAKNLLRMQGFSNKLRDPSGFALRMTMVLFLLLVTLFYILSPKPQTLTPTSFAAGTECQVDTSANARASGLISIGADSALTGKFGNPAGICAYDPKAAFISFKLPTYAELKSRHFDQAKDNPTAFVNKNTMITVNPATQANIPMGAAEDQLYYLTGNLELTGNPSGSRTGIIFIDGNLNISFADITYGTATTGLVFVVKGNVNINAGVQIINTVIISQGTIYTGGTGCTKSSVSAPALTITGSLISLDSTKPIVFCRILSDNSTPAEVINHQSKYVVILRDLFSDTLQKWTEVAGVPYIATQLPTPTPTPTPIPTATPPPPPTLALVANTQSTGILGWNQNCGSSTQKMLIVTTAEWRGDASSQVSGISYGSPARSLTKLNQAFNINGPLVTIWYLIDPDSGTNLVTPTTGTSEVAFGASCWQGVTQSAPINSINSTGIGTPSINISSFSGDMVIDGISVLGSNTLNVGLGQTQMSNISSGLAHIGHSRKVGSPVSTTMTWSTAADKNWAMVGAVLRQAP